MNLQRIIVWKMFQLQALVYWKIFQMSIGGLEKFMDNLLKQRVLELCERDGITVNKLESEIEEISQGSIKNWDKNKPSIEKVAAVAKYFHVSIDYLVGYEGNYDADIRRLMEAASWLTKEDLVALIVIAEQLKKGKA